MEANPDENELLSILNAHGQQFLDSFSLPAPKSAPKKRKRHVEHISDRKETPKVLLIEDEEWGGITEFDGEGVKTSAGSVGDEDFEHNADDFTAESFPQANVVVFTDFSSERSLSNPASKARMKAFMSSKVSKLRQDTTDASGLEKAGADDDDDERTNTQNDAVLHRLVHTQLLSGSLNPELDLTPAHRRKALAGRVLELSGKAKLGKGEKSVRATERNKAAKRVRTGIIEIQKKKERQQLEEAKDLGNYHPTIKKLFEVSAAPSKKKRDRGLKMGVGKFRGGLLKLSRDEISIVDGSGRSRDRRGESQYRLRDSGGQRHGRKRTK